jgi:hypothetical protein
MIQTHLLHVEFVWILLLLREKIPLTPLEHLGDELASKRGHLLYAERRVSRDEGLQGRVQPCGNVVILAHPVFSPRIRAVLEHGLELVYGDGAELLETPNVAEAEERAEPGEGHVRRRVCLSARAISADRATEKPRTYCPSAARTNSANSAAVTPVNYNGCASP